MWDKCVVECLEEAVGTFSLFCKFNSVLDQFVWAFSGVYGPNADSKFQIDIFCGRSSPGYLVGGRFPTRFPNKRVGLSRLTSNMWEFS